MAGEWISQSEGAANGWRRQGTGVDAGHTRGGRAGRQQLRRRMLLDSVDVLRVDVGRGGPPSKCVVPFAAG